jgi:hypothetical protein
MSMSQPSARIAQQHNTCRLHTDHSGRPACR